MASDESKEFGREYIYFMATLNVSVLGFILKDFGVRISSYSQFEFLGFLLQVILVGVCLHVLYLAWEFAVDRDATLDLIKEEGTKNDTLSMKAAQRIAEVLKDIGTFHKLVGFIRYGSFISYGFLLFCHLSK